MAAENRSNYYRYLITECKIIIPNKDPINIPYDAIMGINIEKDFDNLFFPVFNLQLNLNFNLYYNIVMNKDTVKFKVKMEKYAYDENTTNPFKEVVFDTTFAIFMGDDTPFLDKDLYERTVKLLGSAENRTKYDFYLFKDSDITSSRKIINRVVTSSNMTDVIVYMLSKSGASNVLMTPLENSTVYHEIILPPLNVVQAIPYLEKQYGFYNHGSLFFYDFDTIFFINKKAECTAYKTGEFKEVIVQVFKTLNDNSQTPGCFKDNKTKTYTLHVEHGNTEMSTESILNEQLVGKNVNLIDTTQNTTNEVNPDVTSRMETMTNITNNFDNKYLAKMIENYKYENDHIVNMTVHDVDVGCFTPNKKFILSFEDKEVNIRHKGNYRLSYSLFTFIKNGEYFTISGAVQFKKTT